MRGDPAAQQGKRPRTAFRIEPAIPYGSIHGSVQVGRHLHLRQDAVQDDSAQACGSLSADRSFLAEKVVRFLRRGKPPFRGHGRVLCGEVGCFRRLFPLQCGEIIRTAFRIFILPAQEGEKDFREIAIFRAALG